MLARCYTGAGASLCSVQCCTLMCDAAQYCAVMNAAFTCSVQNVRNRTAIQVSVKVGLKLTECSCASENPAQWDGLLVVTFTCTVKALMDKGNP